MINKYLGINKYTLARAEKPSGIYNYIESKENVITIKAIQEAIKALELLTGYIEYTIKITGRFEKGKNEKTFRSYRADENTAIIIDNKSIQFANDKDNTIYKVNIIETFEAIPSMNMEEHTYFSNMIDRVEIIWKE